MFEISWEVPKYDTRQKVSKCCWKNDADRLAWHRIARNCQLVKKKKQYLESTKNQTTMKGVMPIHDLREIQECKDGIMSRSR